jgi:hypothetical protein
MPTRWVTGLIILSWLGTLGWLAYRQWGYLLYPEEPPKIRIDLADEVAPEYASWILERKGQKVGTAGTAKIPRKDGGFTLSSTLSQFDNSLGPVTVTIEQFNTTRAVNRAWEVESIKARAVLRLKMAGMNLKVDAKIQGTVEDDVFQSECDFDSELGRMKEKLQPIPLTTRKANTPLQPIHRFENLRPGQRWTEANIDPVSEALSAATRQVMTKLVTSALEGQKLPFKIPEIQTPKELRAEVLAEPEVLDYGPEKVSCWVIEYTAKDIKSRTWVDRRDGKIIQQEASGLGEKLLMRREHPLK